MDLYGEKFLLFNRKNILSVIARSGAKSTTTKQSSFLFQFIRLLRPDTRQKRGGQASGLAMTVLMLMFCSNSFAQLAGTAGAFSRMGFGARGMGMGNAFTAVKTGENSGYYNPAIVALLKENSASLSYGILSLDRNMNSMFYSQPIDTNAGIAFGILNSGVSKIDGRDIDGFHTETYSTSENQFSLSFALRIRTITIGLTTKLYYYSLFKEVSSTSVGFDFGVVYPITSNITLAGALKDFNAKYRWDTSKLYGQLGNTTFENFPTRQAVGISYAFDEQLGLISAEIEKSSESTTIVRVGGEITPIDALTLRAGIDGWDLKNSDQAHPSFGFTLRTDYTEWKPSLHYAYILEPYGVFSIHVISLSIKL